MKQPRIMLMALICLTSSVMAQTGDSQNASDAHFAFASYLGSGIYRTSGQQAAVLNLPLAVNLEEDTEHRLDLRLPMSFGFFNYQWQDLPDGDLPANIGTATFTPGIEYTWYVNSQLSLESYLDLGAGWNFSEDRQVGIFSTGVSSLYRMAPAQDAAMWVSRLYTAGYNDNSRDQSESYAVLHSGIDWPLAEGWSWHQHQFQPRAFVAAYWYFTPLQLRTMDDNLFVRNGIEFGLSFAIDPVPEWLGVSISRLGLSYRYANGLEVWRLIFDFPF
ncbi:hypothetical protein [Shewanella sp. NIFS-20-20]|uniref:hypothetical protein n=1 Tax=Shewanella sp. NIFS-20-20 TaxID=2853806 RepID=UPI001C4603F0|nr:hypothetical protein [Shewanella sp. NIFS-20-20]MBV7315171.1 hypothetical protein [Shewanella sp. NIFS-20-20]